MKGIMREYPFLVYSVLAAMQMGQFAATAQDWRTVDDFALAGADAEAHGVAVDAGGRIYVVGTANGHAIVRYSANGGTNWSTRDDFVYPGTNNPSNTNNLFNAITVNPQGDLFVGGASAAFVGGVNAGHWIVRRSRDHGVSWETVDDYWRPMSGPSNPGTNASVYSLSSDAQGRVYGAGLMLTTGPSYPRWWVRGSGIGGTNWDSKLVVFAGYGGVSQITWAGQDVYVTGSVSDGVGATGLILRSGNYGASWTTNFVATNESYYAIASDLSGNIYSVGNRAISNTVDWLVRKAAPGGGQWTIIDSSSYQDTCECGVSHPYPRSIAVDASGNICVAGQFQEHWVIYTTNGTTYGANETWFTRQYSAAANQWSTTDLFSYSTNMQGSALGTAIAADGSTFVVGYGTSNTGQRRWVVRKQSAFLPRPRLQIAFGNRSIDVSWPDSYTNSILQWTDSMGANKLWQTYTGTVCVMDGQITATFDLTSGARFFRLKSAAGN